MKSKLSIGAFVTIAALIALFVGREQYPSRVADFTDGEGRDCWLTHERLTGITDVLCRETLSSAALNR